MTAKRPPSPDTAKGASEIIELPHADQTRARRVAESKATIPDLTVSADVDMHDAAKLLKTLEDRGGQTVPTTYRDLVIGACGLALREHPHVNATYRDGRLHVHSRINIGLMIAHTDSSTTVTPTMFDADQRSPIEIATETLAMEERARDATLTPPELAGATFTVADLSAEGINSWQAIVDPSQVAILAIGAVLTRVVAHSEAITLRETMTLTLTCDARAISPARAARFLTRVRELLQTPSLLMSRRATR